MDRIVSALAADAAVVGAMMLALWLVSLAKKDVSIVDVAWGLGFTVLAWFTWWRSARDLHSTLLAAMVTAWGVRLAVYIAVRNHGRGEDVRYQTLRAKYPPFWITSLGIVFALQGALMLVVALPVELGMSGAAGVGPVTLAGMAVFAAGFVIESTADLQMFAFKRAHRGEVMNRGLWKYSRHPNYFGELVLWWGIGLAASMTAPWWAALAGPAVISFLLLRVSGVPMLEAAMKERPGYADYVKNTPAFFPVRMRSRK